VHIGATWRIRLNRSCATAMRPFVVISPFQNVQVYPFSLRTKCPLDNSNRSRDVSFERHSRRRIPQRCTSLDGSESSSHDQGHRPTCEISVNYMRKFGGRPRGSAYPRSDCCGFALTFLCEEKRCPKDLDPTRKDPYLYALACSDQSQMQGRVDLWSALSRRILSRCVSINAMTTVSHADDHAGNYQSFFYDPFGWA